MGSMFGEGRTPKPGTLNYSSRVQKIYAHVFLPFPMYTYIYTYPRYPSVLLGSLGVQKTLGTSFLNPRSQLSKSLGALQRVVQEYKRQLGHRIYTREEFLERLKVERGGELQPTPIHGPT